MTSLSARFDDAKLRRVLDHLSGHPLRQVVTERTTAAARAVLEDARDRWPVLRSQGTGLELTGDRYAKAAASRGHNSTQHSRDLLDLRVEQTPVSVRVVIFSTASWAYKIRSRQVTLAEPARVATFRRRKGEANKDFYSRKQSAGPAKHAWSYLVRDPAKEANRRLAESLAGELGPLTAGA
jgi:hypothetical protein